MGGGVAGCVLANRLSEDASASVLLIESGLESSQRYIVNIPISASELTKTELDWYFLTEPQKNACKSFIRQVGT